MCINFWTFSLLDSLITLYIFSIMVYNFEGFERYEYAVAILEYKERVSGCELGTRRGKGSEFGEIALLRYRLGTHACLVLWLHPFVHRFDFGASWREIRQTWCPCLPSLLKMKMSSRKHSFIHSFIIFLLKQNYNNLMPPTNPIPPTSIHISETACLGWKITNFVPLTFYLPLDRFFLFTNSSFLLLVGGWPIESQIEPRDREVDPSFPSQKKEWIKVNVFQKQPKIFMLRISLLFFS